MNFYAWTFDDAVGYGKVARTLLQCFDLLGEHCWLQSPNRLPDDLKHLARNFHKPDLALLPPHIDTVSTKQFTMYESTQLHPGMVRYLSKRKLVIVPCKQNQVAFKQAGLKHVEVCPLAVNALYLAPPPARPFVFIHVSNDSGVPERKRTEDIVKSFCKTFKNESDVRLIVKKAPEDHRITCFDSRVEIIYDRLQSLDKLYSSAHVGIFLCGQEAWGYSQAELMGLGRPIITPFYGGPADYCDGLCAYSLSYKMVPTPEKTFKRVGLCAKANIADLGGVMRFCYENYDDVVLKGVHAYRHMLGFTVKSMAARLGELL